MLAYASRTGTRRNLAALRAAGWRLLLSPAGCGLNPMGFRYCLDNGAWHHHQAGTPFDENAFEGALALRGGGADFVVVPDIVCGGAASLDFSRRWLPRVLAETQLALIPVQNGMTPAELRPLLGSRVGLFVGGDDEWKEQSAWGWGQLAQEVGCYLHVGRVNSIRRISICAAAGAHSFDGTSASRFAVTIPKLDRARRQRALFWRDDTW